MVDMKLSILWASAKRAGMLLVCVWVASGCGQATRQTGQFEPYVASFEQDAARLNQTIEVNYIVIQFGPLAPMTLGLCNLGADVPTITVNQPAWATLSETQRQIVIYHELGHCVLKKGHDDDSYNVRGDRIKLTVMNSHPLELVDYTSFRDEYLQELFNLSSGNSL